MKTNAIRQLERHGVAYSLRSYEVDEADLSATSVAAKIGMPARQVFKTLVCRATSGAVCFAVVPGDCELDLKRLAKAMGERKVETVPLKQVQPLTGYVRGGTTVLAAKRTFPAFLDESALDHDRIAVSAGVRGLQVQLAPQDYVKATGAGLVSGLARLTEP